MTKITSKLFSVFIRAALVWGVFAISFQVFMAVTQFTNPELNKRIGNEITWAIDGRFN